MWCPPDGWNGDNRLCSDDLGELKAPNLRFALANACYSSATETIATPDHPSVAIVSFIQALVNSGANGAIGFKYETGVSYMSEWSSYFWNYVCKGRSASLLDPPDGVNVNFAMAQAREAVYSDEHLTTLDQMKSLFSEYVGQWDVRLYPVK